MLPLFDVDWRSEEGAAVFYFLRRNVIGGFADGMFRGVEPISRAEAAKILLSAGGFSITHLQNNGRFLDVAECEWYTPYIASAVARGIIQGYPPRHLLFALRNTVNTAEFLKMLALTFNLRENLPHSFYDIPSGAWYARYAGVAWQYNLFQDRGAFLQADRPLSRREAMIALFRLFTATRPMKRPGSEWFDLSIPALPVLPVTELATKVGSLQITSDSVPTPPHQLIIGRAGDQILRFRAEADGAEDVAIAHLQLTASGNSTASLSSLSLFRENETRPFAQATRKACADAPPTDPAIGEAFCANLSPPLIVRKPVAIPGCPHGLTIVARPLLRSLASGAVPGSVFHVFLSDDPQTPSVAAHGLASRQAIPPRSTSVTGNDNLVVTGKFSSVVADPLGAAPIPGTTLLASLRFVAHSQNLEPITLQGIIFTVDAVNVSLRSNGFSLFDPADPVTRVPCAVAQSPVTSGGNGAVAGAEVTGIFPVICDALGVSPINGTFAPAEQRAFVLEGNITQVSRALSSPPSLQVSLDSFSQPANAFGPSASHVHWTFGGTSVFWIEHPVTLLRSTLFGSG